MKMKKLLTMILAVAFAFGVFVPFASAKNYDVSFKLVPNSSHKFSGLGTKGDAEPRCYVTTTGGTVITNNLEYNVRGYVKEGSSYKKATERSEILQGKISQKTFEYIRPYRKEILNGNYGDYSYILCASLHSGNPNKTYTLKGKWNP